ncbi:protein tyrosine phosphatase [Rubellimicrobium sp. CFH 75288]|nr:protein tyrosine phosphatase [Rubellimicrobium sp. CFH 75288]
MANETDGRPPRGLLARLRRDRRRPGWSLADPAARRRAWWHYILADHALLRHRWTNMAEIAPGVWRSNHPTHARFAALSAQGIRTIINLRGDNGAPPWLFARESCEALGLRLIAVRLQARQAPERDQVLALFDAFRSAERPFLMHCKSGADRAGFASALYVLWSGGSMEQARQHLSWRYLHVRGSRTGVLDHVLDLYAAARDRTGIGVEEWFRDAYDADAAQAGFDRRR